MIVCSILTFPGYIISKLSDKYRFVQDTKKNHNFLNNKLEDLRIVFHFFSGKIMVFPMTYLYRLASHGQLSEQLRRVTF